MMIPEQVRAAAKMRAVQRRTTLRGYVIELIKEDCKRAAAEQRAETEKPA